MNELIESTLTLKKFLGLSEENALDLLDTPISVTCNQGNEDQQLMTEFLVEMLSKTFLKVEVNSNSDKINVEIVIGDSKSVHLDARKIFVQWSSNEFLISLSPVVKMANTGLYSVFLRLGAAYCCGAVICQSMPDQKLGLGEKYPIHIKFQDLFGDLGFLAREVDLGRLNVAGMGAVGVWFSDALCLMNCVGELKTFDDDIVSGGNLQRTIYLKKQIGIKKVFAHQELFFPYNERLKLIPVPTRFKPDDGTLPENIVSGVDSRLARRKLQDFGPRKTFDCSTTDISEVTVFFGELDPKKACLGCLYAQIDSEKGRITDIASSLGVPLDEVETERISPRAARFIKVKYPEIDEHQIIGQAYDSYVKELCGQGKLQAAKPGLADDSLAPLCHVSAIAGIFLAIEVVRRHVDIEKQYEWNLWKLNPWTTPTKALRQMMVVNPNCAFHKWSMAPALAAWKKLKDTSDQKHVRESCVMTDRKG